MTEVDWARVDIALRLASNYSLEVCTALRILIQEHSAMQATLQEINDERN